MSFLFSGFADTIQGLQLLGLLDLNPHTALHPKGPDITWVSYAENVQFNRDYVTGRVLNWLICISWLLFASSLPYPRIVVFWCFVQTTISNLIQTETWCDETKKNLSEYIEYTVLSYSQVVHAATFSDFLNDLSVSQLPLIYLQCNTAKWLGCMIS